MCVGGGGGGGGATCTATCLKQRDFILSLTKIAKVLSDGSAPMH